MSKRILLITALLAGFAIPATAADPAGYEQLLQRANILVHQGKTADAHAMLRQALKKPERDAKVYLQLSDLDWDSGEKMRAAKVLLVGLKRFPAAAVLRYKLVDRLLRMDRPADASSQLEKFTLAEQDAPRYQYYKALLAYKQGQVEDSVELLQVLASTDSNLKTDAWYWLGHSYMRQKNKSDAIRAFREVVALESDPAILQEVEQILARLAPAGKRLKYLVGVAAGAEYDSNIKLSVQEDASGREGGRFFAAANMRADPVQYDSGTFGGTLTLYQNYHVGAANSDVDELSVTYLDAALASRNVLSDGAAQMTVQAGSATAFMFLRNCAQHCGSGFGQNVFSERVYLRVSLAGKAGKTHLRMVLEDYWDDFYAGNPGDGDANNRDTVAFANPLLTLSFAAPAGPMDLAMQLRTGFNYALGRNYKYVLVNPQLTLGWWLEKKFRLAADLGYEYQPYINHWYGRVDSIANVGVLARYQHNSKVGLTLKANYENNHGVIESRSITDVAAPIQYDRWTVGLSWDQKLLVRR